MSRLTTEQVQIFTDEIGVLGDLAREVLGRREAEEAERLNPLDLAERDFHKAHKASRSFAHWFVFGQSAAFADLSDGEGDVLQHVPRDRVAAILEARSSFLDRLEAILCEGEEP
jgi:hypothetical protein